MQNKEATNKPIVKLLLSSSVAAVFWASSSVQFVMLIHVPWSFEMDFGHGFKEKLSGLRLFTKQQSKSDELRVVTS